MKIAIGADHAGFNLKEVLKKYLEKQGHEVIDFGTYSTESIDYPDYALKVSLSVKNKEVTYGILVCYTGIGMSITANKVDGVKAALVTSEENAKLTREHNNSNILCLGAKDIQAPLACKIADIFLNTPFLGGRHERRVNKIDEVEKTHGN